MQELHTTAPDLVEPSYRGGEVNDLKELTEEQHAILEMQLSDYRTLNEVTLHSDLREQLRQGNTSLPAGTLIHGLAATDENIQGVARYGVVSGELVGKGEYGETHYCADFFRVDGDTTVADYFSDITGKEPGSRVNPRMEREYLPSNKKFAEKLFGVIVDPTIPEIQPLLEADAYRPDTEELFSGIINTLPVDKQSDQARRLAAILGGVPRSAIAGIVLSPKLASDERTTATMLNAFEGSVPLVSTDGELIVA